MASIAVTTNVGNCNYIKRIKGIYEPGALGTTVKEAQKTILGSEVAFAKCDGRVGGVNDATTTNTLADPIDCAVTFKPEDRTLTLVLEIELLD